ncbi:MAG TPA: hypothetical protein VMX94_10740 [Armatimonadota bacterium]|nr:hypothetical protein [Armatimonadota bacterium]
MKAPMSASDTPFDVSNFSSENGGPVEEYLCVEGLCGASQLQIGAA